VTFLLACLALLVPTLQELELTINKTLPLVLPTLLHSKSTILPPMLVLACCALLEHSAPMDHHLALLAH
jgi:hypothetical protein